MNVDLHQLANSGGFGAAHKVLREAGLWSEANGAGLKRWDVRVTVECYSWVEVVAETMTEAIRKAETIEADSLNWEPCERRAEADRHNAICEGPIKEAAA